MADGAEEFWEKARRFAMREDVREMSDLYRLQVSLEDEYQIMAHPHPEIIGGKLAADITIMGAREALPQVFGLNTEWGYEKTRLVTTGGEGVDE